MNDKNTNISQRKINIFTDNQEIVSLAKNNSPRLLNTCRSTFPAFFDNLKQINADLKKSELIFCVYLKLDFSTKEIALYTFVTPKAIQNRKNRIRKKLKIASDVDIYKWFDEL